ncbi:MAG: hypothetical protein LKF34_06960 [Acidaminococcaceae bacterium]|nr:hypothetical protein [Acidaminococcaceae bacterium]
MQANNIFSASTFNAEALELKLDAADANAKDNPVRYTTEEVYKKLNGMVAEHEK